MYLPECVTGTSDLILHCYPRMLTSTSVRGGGLYVSFRTTGRAERLNLALSVDCADTRIIRTQSRQELLYTRSKIVATARAFDLDAIDMVGCRPVFKVLIDYKSAVTGLR